MSANNPAFQVDAFQNDAFQTEVVLPSIYADSATTVHKVTNNSSIYYAETDTSVYVVEQS